MTELVARVHAALGRDGLVSHGRPYALGLYRSVLLVLFILRQNPVQHVVAELFGCSQSTVSRRLALLGPVLEQVLAEFIPDPAEASRGRVVLVDGTLVTTWDWACRSTELFNGKHRDTGFNLQIAATLGGDLIAVSAPAPGSWHDARAWRESGFPELFSNRETMGDLGYIGTGVLTGRRKPPGQN
ncbi:transposase family protein, partial [Streptomyces sp900116325]|uniref:transposase family protein n=1 Tax=Streptomyces sp. 900116325 TaxID=3154295 RepID=UPI0033C89F76